MKPKFYESPDLFDNEEAECPIFTPQAKIIIWVRYKKEVSKVEIKCSDIKFPEGEPIYNMVSMDFTDVNCKPIINYCLTTGGEIPPNSKWIDDPKLRFKTI